MPLLKEIAACLESIAPLEYQEDYDNSGLQLGDPQKEVNSALLTLDITENVVDEAISLKADIIISHHPLIFSGIKKITGDSPVERIINRCIINNIAVYSCHTNIDSTIPGVSEYAGRKMGLINGKILAPRKEKPTYDLFAIQNEDPKVGLGWIGYLTEPVNEDTFLNMVKKLFNTGALRYSTPIGHPVHKVAFCGGSGAEFIPNAISAGADAYITSDIKYHAFQQAENKLLLIDAGHFETEQFTKALFHDVLTKKFYNFALHISKTKTNPINYI